MILPIVCCKLPGLLSRKQQHGMCFIECQRQCAQKVGARLKCCVNAPHVHPGFVSEKSRTHCAIQVHLVISLHFPPSRTERHLWVSSSTHFYLRHSFNNTMSLSKPHLPVLGAEIHSSTVFFFFFILKNRSINHIAAAADMSAALHDTSTQPKHQDY